MLKNFKIIIISAIFLVSGELSAFNSSSYLIANTAVKLFDFDKAYPHFEKNKEDLLYVNSDNHLLTLVHLNLLSEAAELAKNILVNNNDNQEAWMVSLSHAKLKNNKKVFSDFEKKFKSQSDLLNFIFYNQLNEIKSKQSIARSILEVVQSSITSEQEKTNYTYVLFYLRVATFLDPNLNEAYFYSAQIYQILKKYELAENFYLQISKKHQLYLESQKSIAINKSKRGLFEEAKNNLLFLIELYPNDNNLIIALADLYRTEKKYDKAVLYYSTLINSLDIFSPEYWHLLYMRGICYERSSEWELAEKDFKKSLKAKPNSPQVLNYLAYGWLERDVNLIIAMDMLKEAYRANPDSYYILDSLAWAYYKLNNLQKAAELMEEVVIMAPGEAISLDHLGDIYFALKRKREATYFWKQALDLAMPEDKIIENIQKKINENAG